MHVLIEDVLMPRAFVTQALSGVRLPHLEALLRSARIEAREPALDAFQRTRPASRVLALCAGFAADADRAPIAALLARSHPVDPSLGEWLAQPVAFALAHDHVVLADHRPTMTDDEARALADAVRPAFDAAGMRLDATDARCWRVVHPALAEVVAGEPLRALGGNVDPWLPDGAGASIWRRVHTEVQMIWHDHPVNLAREQRGDAPINGVWLWGGGVPRAAAQPPAERPEIVDALAVPARTADATAWRDALVAIDAEVGPRLRASATPHKTLTLCSETTWLRFGLDARPWWRTWPRPSLLEQLSV